jgi:hypothetical protein
MRRISVISIIICLLMVLSFAAIRVSHLNTEGHTDIALGADIPLQVAELDGGSVITDLGYKIRVNDGSTLHRRWYVLNDPGAPVALSGSGVKTIYRSGEYNFVAVGTGTPSVPIQALEVRMMIFDVWGNHLKTLSVTALRDYQQGTQIDLSKDGIWRTYENEVSETLTVISFVACARRADGISWFFDAKKVLGEVQHIKLKLSEADLSPQKDKPAK